MASANDDNQNRARIERRASRLRRSIGAIVLFALVALVLYPVFAPFDHRREGWFWDSSRHGIPGAILLFRDESGRLIGINATDYQGEVRDNLLDIVRDGGSVDGYALQGSMGNTGGAGFIYYFSKPGSINGRISGVVLRALKECTYQIGRRNNQPWSPMMCDDHGDVDSSGRFHTRGLQPGSYGVSLMSGHRMTELFNSWNRSQPWIPVESGKTTLVTIANVNGAWRMDVSQPGKPIASR